MWGSTSAANKLMNCTERLWHLVHLLISPDPLSSDSDCWFYSSWHLNPILNLIQFHVEWFPILPPSLQNYSTKISTQNYFMEFQIYLVHPSCLIILRFFKNKIMSSSFVILRETFLKKITKKLKLIMLRGHCINLAKLKLKKFLNILKH